jgi:hypothetical protein
MRGQRAAGDGAGDHPRQVEHAQARERAVARVARALARPRRFSRSISGCSASARRRAAKIGPFVVGAHHRHHAAGGIGRGLERLGVPLHQRGLHRGALRLAVQHLADGVAVMPEIGVQPHEARHRGFCRRRRWHPRPAAAACRRRADSARCGTRRRHGAYRPRRSAIARCAISRSAPRQVRPRQCRPAPEGAGNAGCPLHPQPRAQRVESTRVSHHRFTGTPGIPCAMVLTVSFVLSPVTGLCCHRRPQEACFSRT